MDIETAVNFLKATKAIPAMLFTPKITQVVADVEEAVNAVQVAKSALHDATTDYMRNKSDETQAALEECLDSATIASAQLANVLGAYNINGVFNKAREDNDGLAEAFEGVMVKPGSPGVIRELLGTLEDYTSLINSGTTNNDLFWKLSRELSNLRNKFIFIETEEPR